MKKMWGTMIWATFLTENTKYLLRTLGIKESFYKILMKPFWS